MHWIKRLPKLPRPLVRVISRLPALPASAGLVACLNLVAWKTLRELDWSAMYGKRFGVHVHDTGLRAYFSVNRSGFVAEVNEQADVVFTASAEDFMRLALRQEDPDTLFFNRRLRIEGNTDLGLTVKNMLDSVELDVLLGGLPPGMVQLAGRLRHGAA